MAYSTDPNDPNFGLETDDTSPNFGLPQEQEKGGVVSGVLAGLGHALNPINIVKGALDIGGESDISKIGRYSSALGDLLSGTPTKEALEKNIPEVEQQREAVFGQLGTREQAESLTGIGLQAGLLALPFVHGKLREIAFGEKPPVAPEAASQVPEPPIAEPQVPVVPEERFPSLLRSEENLRRGELQQQMNPERGFELVPEPPPDIAPAPTIEQTLETAQTPEARVSPETGFTFPNEPIETSTGIESETARVGGEPSASEIPSTESVTQPEVRTQVGEGTPLRQQGETPETQTQPETVPQAGQVEVGEPQPPSVPPTPETPALEVTPETQTSGVHAEALAERPIDEIPAGTEVSWQEARKIGDDFLNKGGSINKVMADFNRTGKLSLKDIGAGRAYLERLQATTDRAQDALRENPADPVLQQNYGTARAMEQRFSEDFKPMATAASNQLKGFQGKVPLTDDMADSFTSLTRKYGEIQGKPVTPEEAAKADRIAKQNAKVKTEYQAANEELYQKADMEYGRIRTNRTAPPTLEDIGSTFGKVLKEVCDV